MFEDPDAWQRIACYIHALSGLQSIQGMSLWNLCVFIYTHESILLTYNYCALQRGVDLPSLDVTYFTSLSYYILLLFGLRGVFMLFFRDEVIDETQMMRQQMAGAGNPMGNPDPQKALEAEKTAFDLVSLSLSLSSVCEVGQSSRIFHLCFCLALHFQVTLLDLKGHFRAEANLQKIL